MRSVWGGVLLLGLLVLAGCGFQLRGEALLPFASAYVAAPDASVIATGLRQSLAGQQKLAAQEKGAPVHIRVMDERLGKNILSLSGAGKVREYRLVYKVALKVTDERGEALIAPIEIEQMREFTFDDTLILAKQAEEAALHRAMEQEALRQVLRRLAYVKR